MAAEAAVKPASATAELPDWPSGQPACLAAVTATTGSRLNSFAACAAAGRNGPPPGAGMAAPPGPGPGRALPGLAMILVDAMLAATEPLLDGLHVHRRALLQGRGPS